MSYVQLFFAPPPNDQKSALEELISEALPGFKPLKHRTAFLASPPHIDLDLLDYCLFLNETLQPNTVKQYLYEINILLNFLESRGHVWEGLDEQLLRAYRQYRMNPASDSAVGERSWRRSGAAIKGFVEFMRIRGRLKNNPAPVINGTSVLAPRSRRYPADIRSISKDRLERFLRQGLGAFPSHGVATRLRNRTLAELMLKTGMRISEASNLLTVELNSARGSNGLIQLEAVAKRQNLRYVTMPVGVMSLLYTYLKVERAFVVSACQESLRKRSDLFEVSKLAGGVITGIRNGEEFHYRTSKLPIELRMKAVQRAEDRIEPLGIFIGATTGLPIGPAAWHKVFRQANRQIQLHDSTWVPIRSHDFRHTYASNALAQATALTAQRQSDDASLALQITTDPLGMVQRQLGHASPNTTAQYLRQPYTADGSLAKAIDQWVSPLAENGDT